MKRLLVGFKAGDLKEPLLEGDVVCHTLDVYHAHAIEKTHPQAKVVCAAHLPVDDWDEIIFRTGPMLMSGELSLDLLQEIHLLKPKKFILDFVGKERDRNDLLNKVKNDPNRVRSFAARWQASVPGGDKILFTSFPGCFCHRRLDEGGLALAEVVVKELQMLQVKPRKMLDMGCGSGLVGLLVSNAIADVELTMIDSHTRAVEAAELNAKAHGANAKVYLSDNGLDGIEDARFGEYDVFVGNPPYYSDYRIAEVFLDTAKKALKPGGVCYTVAKNAEGLQPVQEKYFPKVEVIRRRNYSILKSEKFRV